MKLSFLAFLFLVTGASLAQAATIVNCYRETAKRDGTLQTQTVVGFKLIIQDDTIRFSDGELRYPILDGNLTRTVPLQKLEVGAKGYNVYSSAGEPGLKAMHVIADKLVIETSLITDPRLRNQGARIERAFLANDLRNKPVATYICTVN